MMVNNARQCAFDDPVVGNESDNALHSIEQIVIQAIRDMLSIEGR